MPSRKGYANVFTYECGLKRSTGQAYVHVTEDRNENNVSFMGLILQKYIPNAASLRQDTWEGMAYHGLSANCKFCTYAPKHHVDLVCRRLSQ